MLDHIVGLPEPKRTVTLFEKEARCVESCEHVGVPAFLFSRIRMQGIPRGRGLHGGERELVLGDDEGLGEDMAIAIDPDANVIAVQRHRFSLSASNIIGYINCFFPNASILLRPILTGDAMQQLREKQILRKLRVRLAGNTNLDFLRDSGFSAQERAEMQSFLNAPFVDITFSVGSNRVGLAEKFHRLTSGFLRASRNGEDGIIHLDISGKNNDESASETIDLLAEKLVYEGEVELKNRSIDTDHLLRIAVAAIVNNRAILSARHV